MNALVRVLQAAKRVHGFCPCCGAFFRLSDVVLFTKDRPPKTEFDRAEDQRARFDLKVAEWEEQKRAHRLEAIQKGRQAARAHVRRIAPFFVERDIEPKDVKVIFSPIKYVVFHGLADGLLESIDLIDQPASSKVHERVQGSLRRAIDAGNMEWRTLRVLEDGRVVREA